jgi:hypothetical protein
LAKSLARWQLRTSPCFNRWKDTFGPALFASEIVKTGVEPGPSLFRYRIIDKTGKDIHIFFREAMRRRPASVPRF